MEANLELNFKGRFANTLEQILIVRGEPSLLRMQLMVIISSEVSARQPALLYGRIRFSLFRLTRQFPRPYA